MEGQCRQVPGPPYLTHSTDIISASYSNASQTEDGAFANYIVAKGDVQIKIPSSISDEDAATLGVSVSTVGQGLYRALELPLPSPDSKGDGGGKWLLIHGASTATGIYGVQYAKLSGFRVITTSSPHNFDYLKSLGAEAVYDYKSPTAGDEIRKLTDNNLKLAWDCAGSGATLVAQALSSDGGKYSTIAQVDKDEVLSVNPNVDGPHHTLAYSVLGEEFTKRGNTTPPKPEELEFAKKFTDLARQLLEQGKIKAPQTFVNQGGSGLEGVLVGLDKLRNGEVSGGKLVYKM